MAKEYIELEPGNEYGVISLNKTVFSTMAQNVIEEDENVQIAKEQNHLRRELSQKWMIIN